jgi:DNA-binding NarL/FixJ family response regulator
MTDPAEISIVIVDDTTHVRRMLRTMLELDGFTVVGEAGSGVEAIELASSTEPSVVVMDYKMPDIDGIETARRICARRPEQVVIMYTAYADADVEARARDAGVSLVLNKVEGLESLEREISRLCGSLF